MLDILIPKSRYNKLLYTNLEDRAVDMIIPERYGIKTNITPVCIDTLALTYKLANREIKAITAIVTKDATLVEGEDYSTDLANAQFTLVGTPELQPNETYYMVFEGDWAINGDWLEFYGFDDAYADGNAYEINGVGAWNAVTTDLTFVMYGKETQDGTESMMLEQEARPGSGFLALNLRDHADRTKIAMKFKTLNNGISFFVTRIFPRLLKTGGFPDGKLRRVTLYSDEGSTAMGIPSSWDTCDYIGTNNNNIPFAFADREIPSSGDILVDIEGYKIEADLMDNVSDILKDVLVNVAGVPVSDLDIGAFDALKIARTEEINPQLDKEMPTGSFIKQLESGQLFKFMPTLAGKFSPRVYTAALIGDEPHLRDQDFLWFKNRRNLGSVKRRYVIEYNEDPTTQLFFEKETLSTVAEHIYQNKETLQVATYLKDVADAEALGISYKRFYEYPQREIEFEVKSYLLDKIPTDKVKITRTRGDNTSGTFDAVLFRILKLTKRQSTGTVVCKAVLDTQTY